MTTINGVITTSVGTTGETYDYVEDADEIHSAAHAAEHAALTYKIPYILAQSGVPVCLAPNGTVATDGTITLGTAFARTYSLGIWLYLPANAIVGGLAGLYWAVMSSTTVGQVYTNFMDTSAEALPVIPIGSLVAAVGSNAAYTQTTGADITLVTAVLPGGSLGLSGQLLVGTLFSYPNNANNKVVRVMFGGTQIVSATTTASVVIDVLKRISNRGSENAQIIHTTPSLGAASGSAVTQGTVDTTVDKQVNIAGQLAVATDFVIAEWFCFTVYPS